MRKLFYFTFLLLLICPALTIAQESTDENENNAAALELMTEVNRRASLTDNINSTGDITVKASGVDESGSIEIRVKKKDDVWFKLEGPLGIDVAEGHFNRTNFVYYNALGGYSITGPTTLLNIAAISRMAISFDEMVNAFSGTVRVVRYKGDTASVDESGSQKVLIFKSHTGGGSKITRKYKIDKTNYTVTNYTISDSKGRTTLSIDFGNLYVSGESWYARQVEIRNPLKGVYVKLRSENYKTNQTGLGFSVFVPSDAKKKVWTH
ncbi:hypothetical protein BH10BAC5_BH10BAC5_09160 [soil metagenome]